MNHSRDNKQNNKKEWISNNNSKYHHSRNDLSRSSFSFHDSRKNYYKEESKFRNFQRKALDPQTSIYLNHSKPNNYKERSYSRDTLNSDETYFKERKNQNNNIISKDSRECRNSIKFEEDQRFSNKPIYSPHHNYHQKYYKPQTNNFHTNSQMNFPQNNNPSNNFSFYDEPHNLQNNINKLNFSRNFNHSTANYQQHFVNKCNQPYASDNQNEIYETFCNKNFFNENEKSNSQILTTEISAESPVSSSEIIQNDLKLEPSILTSLICKKSSDNLKLSRKILKQNVTDYTIEQDRKLFSSYFNEVITTDEPFMFTGKQFYEFDKFKIYSEEHKSKEILLKNIKNEISFLSKKMSSERNDIRNMKDRIPIGTLNKKLLKIKQERFQNALDDIFSEN